MPRLDQNYANSIQHLNLYLIDYFEHALGVFIAHRHRLCCTDAAAPAMLPKQWRSNKRSKFHLTAKTFPEYIWFEGRLALALARLKS